MTETLKGIIESLPIIISYIAYGSVFLAIYRFITFKDKKQELTEYFLSCATISFVIKTLCSIILALLKLSKYENTWIYYFCVLIITSILAFIIAQVSKSKRFNRFLLRIKIERTTNSTIWDDVLEPNTLLVVHIKNKDLAYVGYHKYSEDRCSNPKIVLYYYQLVELSTTNVLVDYSKDSNRAIMIDTNEIDTIEFVYKNR